MTDRELIERARKMADSFMLVGGLPYAAIHPVINDLADRLETLASRPDGWMEIESAPRDGTWVVLWMIKPTPHGYASEGPHPVIAKWDGQNCWDVPFEDAWFVDADFTHWRRLPPAPQPDK